MDPSKIPFVPSPNIYLGRGGNKIQYIILHSMAGYYGQKDHSGTINFFQHTSSKVSAHYLLSQKGEITQMVKDSDRAWHCYLLNGSSIGIEHEDKTHSEDPKWVTTAMWNASVELSAYLCKKYNIPVKNIMGHNDPFVTALARKAGRPDMIHGDPKHFDIQRYRIAVQVKLDGK